MSYEDSQALLGDRRSECMIYHSSRTTTPLDLCVLVNAYLGILALDSDRSRLPQAIAHRGWVSTLFIEFGYGHLLTGAFF